MAPSGCLQFDWMLVRVSKLTPSSSLRRILFLFCQPPAEDIGNPRGATASPRPPNPKTRMRERIAGPERSDPPACRFIVVPISPVWGDWTLDNRTGRTPTPARLQTRGKPQVERPLFHQTFGRGTAEAEVEVVMAR